MKKEEVPSTMKEIYSRRRYMEKQGESGEYKRVGRRV